MEYYRDEAGDAIADSKSFKFKTNIIGSTPNYNDE